MNGHKDQPIDPYSLSYWLQDLHQGVRGGGSGFGKGLGPVLETVPCSLLYTLCQGDKKGYGGPPRPTLK